MDVYDAIQERLKVIFEDFDNVLVAFSCGKDSGVMLNLAYEYAKKNNMLHKLAFYYEDYEAGYKFTHEFADRMFKYVDVPRKYWICLPISAACSVSMYQPKWIPWHPEEQDIWVRKMPKYDYVINMDNCPFPFDVGTKGFDTRHLFAEWFSNKYGKTAVLIGIRAKESLTRRAIFTSIHRKFMHKGLRYSKQVDDLICNFYPLIDWDTPDIWIANYKFQFDYNKIYDLYYQAGLTIDQMRVASPFHFSGQSSLKLFRVIDPDSWGKMVGRVNGCNFGGIYGNTNWRKIKKPDGFTWKQFAEFLISTLPEKVKKKFIKRLETFQKSWKESGYGRNPRIIRAMREEGMEIENTHEISKLCTKPDVYEIIKIKSGFPDETNVHTNFRICPSWKGVCITIMKNDWTLQYMGCSRTKDENIKKRNALKRFKRQ